MKTLRLPIPPSVNQAYANNKSGKGKGRYWVELRDRIGHCVLCGSTDQRLIQDHINPLARGGCDCIQNIQPLCGPCNASKGAS